MIIDVVWLSMILTALVFSIYNNTVGEVSSAIFMGAERAVSISISLLGGMAFWLGITEIAQKSGLAAKLNKIIFPLINALFPSFKNNDAVKQKISLNITANLFGLGNAATPLGIEAVNEMAEISEKRDAPTKEIILFVAINTASLQILPTSMAALRSSFGSEEPFSILIPVWIVSISVMVIVVVMCKICEKRWFGNELLR